MKVIKNEVFQASQNNLQSHSDADVEIIPQETSNDTYLQSEGLSSTNGDSLQTGETSARQWLYNVLGGISALVKEFPIYAETPDWLTAPEISPRLPPSGCGDSCGAKGHNAKEVVGDLLHSIEPDFGDGTWMTIRIRIPQTILNRRCLPSTPHQSDGDNIHGQTEVTTGDCLPVKNAVTPPSCGKGERGQCADVGTYAPDGYMPQGLEEVYNHMLKDLIGKSD